MTSFKQLKSSDVLTLPITVNKQWSFNYSGSENSQYVKVYNGSFREGTFFPESEPQTEGCYDRLIYNQVNQLFYNKYVGGLSSASLMSSLYYESASGERPSSSFFPHNGYEFINNFPTGSGSNIRVMSISPQLFGDKILPNTFEISSSEYVMKDDGEGNIYSSSYHVGNIFYPNGLVVITEPDNQSTFPSSDSVISFQNEVIIYEQNVICHIDNDEFNLSYNPTLLKGNMFEGNFNSKQFVSPFPEVKDFATSSLFEPYATTVGLYNNNNELLAVAKFGSPIPISRNTNTTIIIRFDK